jgi:copper transport protein
MKRALPWAQLLLACAAPLAQAHAVLLHSSPAADERLEVSPAQIELQFNESVGPVFFRVIDQTGRDVGAPGALRFAGNGVFLPLGARLPPGNYVVSFRVVSGDTHPVAGAFAFAVGESVVAGAAQRALGAAGAGAVGRWAVPAAANRALLYGSVMLAIGSTLLIWLVPWPPAAARVVRWQGAIASGAAALAFVLALGLGGADIVGGDASALLQGSSWAAAAASTLAPSALLGLAGAALCFSRFRGEGARRAARPPALGAALLLASFLVTGHAATAPPLLLAVASVALHVVGAAFWAAAFLPLIAVARRESAPLAARVMERFSACATWFVGMLLLSGVIVTWIQVRAIANLQATPYGQRLLWKLGFVVALLAIAAINKSSLTPRLMQADAAAPRALVRSIRLEIALMLFVVAIAASLTMTPPPRAATSTAGASSGYTAQWQAGEHRLAIEITPAQRGPNMIMLQFLDAAGRPVAMKSATVELALPAAGIADITKDGEALPDGRFHVMVPETVVAGEWSVSVSGFIDDFDKLQFEGRVRLD